MGSPKDHVYLNHNVYAHSMVNAEEDISRCGGPNLKWSWWPLPLASLPWLWYFVWKNGDYQGWPNLIMGHWKPEISLASCKRKYKRDVKCKKGSIYCLWRWRGPGAETREQPLRAESDRWLTASKEMRPPPCGCHRTGFLQPPEQVDTPSEPPNKSQAWSTSWFQPCDIWSREPNWAHLDFWSIVLWANKWIIVVSC